MQPCRLVSLSVRGPFPHANARCRLSILYFSSCLFSLFPTGVTNFLPSLQISYCTASLLTLFHRLAYQCIMKGYNSVITRWKGCIGTACGKGHGAAVLSGAATLANLLVFTNPKAQLVVDKLKDNCTERRKHGR